MENSGTQLRHILVLGATGKTGIEILKQTLALNYRVTAIVRSESKLPTTLKRIPNLLLIQGQIDNYDDLDQAMEMGQDAVVCLYGPTLFQDKFSTTICSRAQRVAQDVMRKHGVRRLIVVTSQGVRGSENAITPIRHSLFARRFLRPIMEDKEEQEAIIRAAAHDFDYTIFRPGRLNNGSLTGNHLISVEPIKEGRISRADLAKIIVDELRLNQYIGSSPTVLDCTKRSHKISQKSSTTDSSYATSSWPSVKYHYQPSSSKSLDISSDNGSIKD